MFCAGGGGSKPLVKEGVLAYSNMSAEGYSSFLNEAVSANTWSFYNISDPAYADYLVPAPDTSEFFDSLTDMLMALDAGRINFMEMPLPVGEYFLSLPSNSDKYITYYRASGVDYYLSMGFSKGSKWFEPFNAAIKAMNEDDTLLLLKAKYVMDSANKDMKPITFEKFPDAETVKIAVTGDMPPIDYVAADGSAAGFNTALLAEIAKRLKVNAEFISIDTGARATALASKSCDAVFWMETGQFKAPDGSRVHDNVDKEDMPERTIITEAFLESPLVYVTLSSSPLLQK